jgi:ABC-type Fe3+ transport system substrate-binding protein
MSQAQRTNSGLWNWFLYDFNAYRGQYTDKAPVQFVVPKEGSVVFPYVMALVNKGPNAENGKKVLDFVLSDASQTMWGNAYLRPVFADKLSAEVKAKFLPDADYARAKAVDLNSDGSSIAALTSAAVASASRLDDEHRIERGRHAQTWRP